jgi:hypothetical protein
VKDAGDLNTKTKGKDDGQHDEQEPIGVPQDTGKECNAMCKNKGEENLAKNSMRGHNDLLGLT